MILQKRVVGSEHGNGCLSYIYRCFSITLSTCSFYGRTQF